ncbi:uncharacterized protein LOC128205361 isoform X2 [Mya arenaria]|nr:uncharacterized protein LOC128205361 isoform X2 [Mya arenaria]
MRQLHIDTMDDYTKHFETPGNKNWLKGAVAVNITKRGLASFACQVCDEIRVHNLKLALKQLFPDLCGNCSIVEAIPCDPANTICNAGKCLFHNGRVFRPCPIVKCNNYRNTISDKITKGIDIGVTCKSCNTPEIVHCNPKNRVCNHGRCKFHHDPTTKKVILNKPCLKNICDTLRNAIEHSHRFSNPSWKNTDTRKWCVNAWDIAKCFMPPDGYADVDNQDDTDLNGIISVFINCEEIQPYFTADLSHAQNICVKVREVGKRLRHAPGLDVNDADLKNWFSDLKALFCDVTFNTACPNAQTAIDQLEKLENDDLKIERSDIIAAIKDSVSCLKRLKPSFDPEALDDIRHQIGILENTLEEVIAEGIHKLERATEAGVKDIVHATEEGREDIRDEINRGIVTIRGSSETSEIAVDEFTRELKKNLINYHRKYNSTLTLGPVLELHDAKLEDFYVPPKIVKRNLINYNREYISTLTHGPAFELDDAGLEDFNVPPKIVKNIQVALDNVEEGHGYTSGTITTFEQLFDSKQIVVITADAGVGKTSL